MQNGVHRSIRGGAWVITLCLMFGTLASAQTDAFSRDFGSVTLRVGTSRDAVVEQLKRGGYKLIDKTPEKGFVGAYVVHDDLDPAKTSVFSHNDGELLFRSGILHGISKQIGQVNNDRELAALLFLLIQRYEKEKTNVPCDLSTELETISSTLDAKEIRITCFLGPKSFRVTTLRWVITDNPQAQFHVGVFELVSLGAGTAP